MLAGFCFDLESLSAFVMTANTRTKLSHDTKRYLRHVQHYQPMIDVRRHIEIEESDLLSWLSEIFYHGYLSRNIPIIPVITKADKLSKSKQKPASMALQHQLNMKQAPVLFSSLSKEGIQTLWHRILSISKPNK